jgi:hypothetical protein
MLRTLSAVVGLLTFFVLAVHADPQAARRAKQKADKSAAQAADVKEKALLRQRLLRRQFEEFKAAVLRVKQRLEKGSAEDRARAKALEKALNHIDKTHLDTEFTRLVRLLDDKSLKNVGDVLDAMQLSKKLSDEIASILRILREDNLASRLRRDNRRLAEVLNELDAIIRDQRIVRTKTELKTASREELGRSQKNVSERTEKLAEKLGALVTTKAQGTLDAIAKAHKLIRAANQDQRVAEKNITADKRAAAILNQQAALDKLLAAKKELEKLLLQNREEEHDHFLTTLESRCREMLAMQREVKRGTIEVHKSILGNRGQKASRANQQDAGRLSDREQEIVKKADKAIAMVEEEGDHIAIAEILKQARTDMSEVQKRLGNTTVGLRTQAIEQDIIDTLEELIKALHNARVNPPRPPEPGGDGPHPPPHIDKVADLKLIRSMQMKVNRRTKLYGDEYVAKEGEQTADAKLREKLRELSERQAKLFTITRKIVKER